MITSTRHPELAREGLIPALTLRQPWAFAVFHAGKDIENREKNTRIRGRVVFQVAARKPDKNEREYHRQACEWMVSRGLARSSQFPGMRPLHLPATWGELPIIPPIDALPYGVLLGTAEITDVHPAEPIETWGEPRTSPILRWKMREQYGYQLANVKPCVPKPWKGLPGWFWIPASDVVPTAHLDANLVDRMREAHAFVCARCKKPVHGLQSMRNTVTGALTVRALCHGAHVDRVFSEREQEAIAFNGLQLIEVFT